MELWRWAVFILLPHLLQGAPPVILTPSLDDALYRSKVIIGSALEGSTRNVHQCVVAGKYSTIFWERLADGSYFGGVPIPEAGDGGWFNGNITTNEQGHAVRTLHSEEDMIDKKGGSFRCVAKYTDPQGDMFLVSSMAIRIEIPSFSNFVKMETTTVSTSGYAHMSCVDKTKFSVSPIDLERQLTLYLDFHWYRTVPPDSWPWTPANLTLDPLESADNIITAFDQVILSPVNRSDITKANTTDTWLYACRPTAKPPQNFLLAQGDAPGNYYLSDNVMAPLSSLKVKLIASSDADINATEGDIVHAYCAFSADNYGFPTVHWKFNDSLDTPPGYASSVDNGHASISFEASTDFAGTFSCWENGFKQKSFKLVVFERFRLASDTHMMDQYVGLVEMESTSVLFTCELIPPLREFIHWLENGQLLSPTADKNFTGHSYQKLLFKNVSKSNMGAVSCYATNEAGHFFATARLLVYADPRIVVHHSAVSGEGGSAGSPYEIKILVQPGGIPTATFNITATFTPDTLAMTLGVSWRKMLSGGNLSMPLTPEADPFVTSIVNSGQSAETHWSVISFEVRGDNSLAAAEGVYYFEMVYDNQPSLKYRSHGVIINSNKDVTTARPPTTASPTQPPTTAPTYTCTCVSSDGHNYTSGLGPLCEKLWEETHSKDTGESTVARNLGIALACVTVAFVLLVAANLYHYRRRWKCGACNRGPYEHLMADTRPTL